MGIGTACVVERLFDEWDDQTFPLNVKKKACDQLRTDVARRAAGVRQRLHGLGILPRNHTRPSRPAAGHRGGGCVAAGLDVRFGPVMLTHTTHQVRETGGTMVLVLQGEGNGQDVVSALSSRLSSMGAVMVEVTAWMDDLRPGPSVVDDRASSNVASDWTCRWKTGTFYHHTGGALYGFCAGKGCGFMVPCAAASCRVLHGSVALPGGAL